MRLLLVRHAKAFDRDPVRWPDDSKRPLTEDGIDSFTRMARRLPRSVEPPELVLASSWSRAWSTAELLEQEAGWPAPEREPMLEEADESQAASRLFERFRSERAIDALALVGHEPFLSRFGSMLLCGRSDGVALGVRKGAVLEFEIDAEAPVGATLGLLVHPGTFRRKRNKV